MHPEETIKLDELLELVKENSLFSMMSADQLEHLMGIIKEVRKVAAGEFVVREKEEADNIYIIRMGAFDVLKMRHDSNTESV